MILYKYIRKTIYLCLAHINHLNLRQRLTYVLNNIETPLADSLKNMLPQNFDKSLLKLVNVEINKYLCADGLMIC